MALVMSCAYPGCVFIAVDRADYLVHCKNVHHKLACPMVGCMLMFARQRSVDNHYKVKHQGIRFGCSLCPTLLVSDPSSVYSHYRSTCCAGKIVEVPCAADADADAGVTVRSCVPVVSAGVADAAVVTPSVVILSDVLVRPAIPIPVGVASLDNPVTATMEVISRSPPLLLGSSVVTPGRSVVDLNEDLVLSSSDDEDEVVRDPDGIVLGRWVDESDGVAALQVTEAFLDDLLNVDSASGIYLFIYLLISLYFLIHILFSGDSDDESIEGADDDDGDVGGEEAEDEGTILYLMLFGINNTCVYFQVLLLLMIPVLIVPMIELLLRI